MGKTKLEERVEAIEERWNIIRWVLKFLIYAVGITFYFSFMWWAVSFSEITSFGAYIVGIIYTILLGSFLIVMKI